MNKNFITTNELKRLHTPGAKLADKAIRLQREKAKTNFQSSKQKSTKLLLAKKEQNTKITKQLNTEAYNQNNSTQKP